MAGEARKDREPATGSPISGHNAITPATRRCVDAGGGRADLGLPALVGPFPLEWGAQRTALAKPG